MYGITVHKILHYTKCSSIIFTRSCKRNSIPKVINDEWLMVPNIIQSILDAHSLADIWLIHGIKKGQELYYSFQKHKNTDPITRRSRIMKYPDFRQLISCISHCIHDRSSNSHCLDFGETDSKTYRIMGPMGHYVKCQQRLSKSLKHFDLFDSTVLIEWHCMSRSTCLFIYGRYKILINPY